MIKTGLGLGKKARSLKIHASKVYYTIKFKNKQKVFCVGLNKTGTTSLGEAMKSLGFTIGNQHESELLFHDWVKRDFKRLIKYFRTANFFQDVPISYPFTYIAADQAFPGSKFILTVRDNPEQWYNSLINFHGKLFANGRVPPTVEDLKNANYVYKGFPYDTMTKVMNVADKDIYNKDILIENYLLHNKVVKDYFMHRPEDLLVLNVAEKGAFQKLCKFLNIQSESTDFPWKNKT